MRVTPKQKQLEADVAHYKAAIAKYEADHPGVRDAITAAENHVRDVGAALEDVRAYERQVTNKFVREARIRTAKNEWHPDFVAGVEKAIGFEYRRRDELRRSQYGSDPLTDAMHAIENSLVGAADVCKRAAASAKAAHEKYSEAGHDHYEISRELNRLERYLEAHERDLKVYLAERRAQEDMKKDQAHVKAVKNEEERRAELREARAKIEDLRAGKLGMDW